PRSSVPPARHPPGRRSPETWSKIASGGLKTMRIRSESPETPRLRVLSWGRRLPRKKVHEGSHPKSALFLLLASSFFLRSSLPRQRNAAHLFVQRHGVAVGHP